jgi:hypothetical protein
MVPARLWFRDYGNGVNPDWGNAFTNYIEVYCDNFLIMAKSKKSCTKDLNSLL